MFKRRVREYLYFPHILFDMYFDFWYTGKNCGLDILSLSVEDRGETDRSIIRIEVTPSGWMVRTHKHLKSKPLLFEQYT